MPNRETINARFLAMAIAAGVNAPIMEDVLKSKAILSEKTNSKIFVFSPFCLSRYWLTQPRDGHGGCPKSRGILSKRTVKIMEDVLKSKIILLKVCRKHPPSFANINQLLTTAIAAGIVEDAPKAKAASRSGG